MNEISNRFIEIYKGMKLTGYKMGKVSSIITKQKISNIEKGITDVSIDIISDFCKIYKADAFYILTGEGQMLKETSPSPPASEKESVYKELFEKKEKELSDLRTEKDSEIKTLEHRIWKLEQELQVFTSKKKTVQEWEDASDAADTMDGTLGQQ